MAFFTPERCVCLHSIIVCVLKKACASSSSFFFFREKNKSEKKKRKGKKLESRVDGLYFETTFTEPVREKKK